MSKKVRIVGYILNQQFRESLGSTKVICGYVSGILLSVITVLQYLHYVGDRSINFCEPVVMLMVNPLNRFVIFIGLILVLSNPPFITSRAVMLFYRITRNAWGIVTVLYIAIHTFLYYGVLFVISMIVGVGKSYVGNIWSRAIVRLVSVEKASAISEYGLSIPESALIENISPDKAALFLYITSCFCGILLVFLAFVISLRKSAIWGNLVILMIQFVGLSVCRQYMRFIPFQVVPFSVTDLELAILNKTSLFYIMGYFMLTIGIVLFVIFKSIKNMELDRGVGETNEEI